MNSTVSLYRIQSASLSRIVLFANVNLATRGTTQAASANALLRMTAISTTLVAHAYRASKRRPMVVGETAQVYYTRVLKKIRVPAYVPHLTYGNPTTALYRAVQSNSLQAPN